MEVELSGDDGQFGHILFAAPGMAADEVGDELLVETLLTVEAVELLCELIELLERGLAHELQDTVAGMLGGHLQPAADMAADQFAGILLGRAVGLFVLAPI